MKIVFEDKSYISTEQTDKNTIIISVGAKNAENIRSLIVNTVELNKDQVKQLLEFVG